MTSSAQQLTTVNDNNNKCCFISPTTTTAATQHLSSPLLSSTDDTDNTNDDNDDKPVVELLASVLQRAPQLPHTRIEQCVSLYSTGVYDDLLLLDGRHRGHNIGNNSIGGGLTSGAFHARRQRRQRAPPTKGRRWLFLSVPTPVPAPTKFISTAKQWTAQKMAGGGRRRHANNGTHKKTTTKMPTIRRHHHQQPYAGTLLRHIRPDKELQWLPIKYFVRVTHSGHSVTPFRTSTDGGWSKHGGCEETVERINSADYQQFSPIADGAAPKCCYFDDEPLQRVERSDELGTYPLKAYCRNAAKARMEEHEKEAEEEEKAVIAALITRIRKMLLYLAPTPTAAGVRRQRKNKTTTTNNTGDDDDRLRLLYPPFSVYIGPYTVLSPADQLMPTNIETTICVDNNKETSDDINSNSQWRRHEPKKRAAKIFVVADQQGSAAPVAAADNQHRGGDEAATASSSNLQVITTTSRPINELSRAPELPFVAPIDSYCCVTNRIIIERKMRTAKLILKALPAAPDNEQNYGTTEDKLEKPIVTHQPLLMANTQQQLHLLTRVNEFKCRPIDDFVTIPMGQLRHGMMANGVEKTKKTTAKIVIKIDRAATPPLCDYDAGSSEKCQLCRKEELKYEPIEQFVDVGTNNDEHLNKLDKNKCTAKIVVKNGRAAAKSPHDDDANVLEKCQQFHTLCRKKEFKYEPFGQFVKVVTTNKQTEELNKVDEKKYTAKIFVKMDHADATFPKCEAYESSEKCQQFQPLCREAEFEYEPIGHFVEVSNKKLNKVAEKKYTANIVIKMDHADAAPPKCEAYESSEKCQQFQPLYRKDELKCEPIGQFVEAVATNNPNGEEMNKVVNEKKSTAKIVLKIGRATVTPSQCDDDNNDNTSEKCQQFHSLCRKEELKYELIGRFVEVVATNKRNDELNRVDEEKKVTEKKCTAKIVIKPSSPHNGTTEQQQRHGKQNVKLSTAELEEQEEDKSALMDVYSLRRSNELNWQPLPIGALQKSGEASKELDVVQQNKELATNDQQKKKKCNTSSREPKSRSQIVATKDKTKKKKNKNKEKKQQKQKDEEKKKKKEEKKNKKQNGGGQQQATTTTTALAAASRSSSSSSSSSSTDAETEAIHVLVYDEERQQQRQQIMPSHEKHAIATTPVDGTITTNAANAAAYGPVQDGDGSMPLSQQHTTTAVRTWHEESTGPQRVTTEVDEHGNVVRRVVTTEHVRHTVQTHSYQTMTADEDNTTTTGPPITTNADDTKSDAAMPSAAPVSPLPPSLKSPPPVPPARRRSSTAAVAATMPPSQFENGDTSNDNRRAVVVGQHTTEMNGRHVAADDGDLGELVSTKLVTTGNRTIETLTYKKEQDGTVETRVEHRITIHSNDDDIDHEAELDRAIAEATKMNPNMKVEKVEVERSSS